MREYYYIIHFKYVNKLRVIALTTRNGLMGEVSLSWFVTISIYQWRANFDSNIKKSYKQSNLTMPQCLHCAHPRNLHWKVLRVRQTWALALLVYVKALCFVFVRRFLVFLFFIYLVPLTNRITGYFRPSNFSSCPGGRKPVGIVVGFDSPSASLIVRTLGVSVPVLYHRDIL